MFALQDLFDAARRLAFLFVLIALDSLIVHADFNQFRFHKATCNLVSTGHNPTFELSRSGNELKLSIEAHGLLVVLFLSSKGKVGRLVLKNEVPALYVKTCPDHVDAPLLVRGQTDSLLVQV